MSANAHILTLSITLSLHKAFADQSFHRSQPPSGHTQRRQQLKGWEEAEVLVHVGVPEIEVQRCSVPTVSDGLGIQQKMKLKSPIIMLVPWCLELVVTRCWTRSNGLALQSCCVHDNFDPTGSLWTQVDFVCSNQAPETGVWNAANQSLKSRENSSGNFSLYVSYFGLPLFFVVVLLWESVGNVKQFEHSLCWLGRAYYRGMQISGWKINEIEMKWHNWKEKQTQLSGWNLSKVGTNYFD